MCLFFSLLAWLHFLVFLTLATCILTLSDFFILLRGVCKDISILELRSPGLLCLLLISHLFLWWGVGGRVFCPFFFFFFCHQRFHRLFLIASDLRPLCPPPHPQPSLSPACLSGSWVGVPLRDRGISRVCIRKYLHGTFVLSRYFRGIL